MIVYNVKRRWFTMKNDAEAYRRAEKLPPSATFTLRIDSRDDLASLLNGLCGVFSPAIVEDLAPAEVIEGNQITDQPPDFVPRFLVEDWERRMKGIYR
ncbi:MAG: hypothetical protein E5X41_14865 [Mesorhizobium sp.]|nr:MAG: hypothetical protein E5X41_14865 [Mesorhizobium sp.]